jgi:hypothetical protein
MAHLFDACTRRKTMDALVESVPNTAFNAITRGDPYRVKLDTDL